MTTNTTPQQEPKNTAPTDVQGVAENIEETVEVADPTDTVAVPIGPDDALVDVPVIPDEGITRRLSHKDFIGNGIRINEKVIIERARELGIEPELLLAFTKVEAPKGPYLKGGEPTILFEAHVFARNTRPKNKFNNSHPTLSSATWDSSLYGRGGSHQYERLLKAMELDQRAALMACSWGSWQVLGENYEQLGFKTVEDMVLFCVASEVNQFEVFVRFIKTKKGLLAALQSKDFDSIAYLYNGKGYRANKYDEKIQQEYENLISTVLRRGSQGTKVVSLQKLLNMHGANPPIKVDGWFGVATDNAVREMQAKWGIVIDGVVGPETYERLASERLPGTGVLTSKRVAGATLTAATGVATVSKGVQDYQQTWEVTKSIGTLEQLKSLQDTTTITREVVSTAKDAAEHVVGVQQGTSMTLIFVGVVIIGIAAFFAWTKLVDNKKQEGTQ